MTHRYAVYGLRLCADCPVPGLLPDTHSDSCDVAVHLDGIRPGAEIDSRYQNFSEVADDDGNPLLRVARCHQPSGLYFRYSDGTAFLITDTGCEIWAEWRPPLTLEDTATYLLGPMLGFVLRLRGVLSLHASVIDINGKAVGFMGAAGSGKSTLAAAFAHEGFAVMSDDILALKPNGNAFFVQAGYPRLRLWPDSAKALFGSASSLPKLTPNWDKRYLDLTAEPFRFQPEARPLSGIYVLGNIERGQRHEPVAPMSPRDAMLSLLKENGQGMLLDNAIRAREFAQMAELVRRVPVKWICTGGNARYPSDQLEAIAEDLGRQRAPAHV